MRYLLSCSHELLFCGESVNLKYHQFKICYIRGQFTFRALYLFNSMNISAVSSTHNREMRVLWRCSKGIKPKVALFGMG